VTPGIFARTFPRPALEQALDAARDSGVTALQFNLALTGGPALPERIAPQTATRIGEAFAARGLEMVAVSGTYNMAHPDPGARARGAARLRALVRAAPALGTDVVTLCTGTRDPDAMWRGHPDNAGPEAWRDMLDSMAVAAREAEAAGVTLGIEPEPANVVADARAARRLLDELASPAVRVVVDAANLVAGGALEHQREILEDAFALLGDELVLAHAKDLERGGAFVAAGAGALDYELYVRLLGDAGYDGALVLHGLTEAEVPAAVRFLESQIGAGR
jgi:sugar phosphate isomerase/epimerase